MRAPEFMRYRFGRVTISTDHWRVSAAAWEGLPPNSGKCVDEYIGSAHDVDAMKKWLQQHLDETDTVNALAAIKTGVVENLPRRVEEAWWDIKRRVAQANKEGKGMRLSAFDVYAMRVFGARYPASRGTLFDG